MSGALSTPRWPPRAAWFMHNPYTSPVLVQGNAMTSINLTSPWLPRNCPALRDARPAYDGPPDRAGPALACGVLLSSMLAVGCASGLQAAETRGSASKTPPRTQVAGGSPQSYEVLGKRYNVRASSDGYRERGTASWYGRPFDGRPTSSGEMYDMNELTAAHPTLPIPTWVEVTNLKNGKRVVVKVNDRGPFVGKRLIDLSYGAATALDMVRDGNDASRSARARWPAAGENADSARQSEPEPHTGARARRCAGTIHIDRLAGEVSAGFGAAPDRASVAASGCPEAIRRSGTVHEARRGRPARPRAQRRRFHERVCRNGRQSPQVVASCARRSTRRRRGG